MIRFLAFLFVVLSAPAWASTVQVGVDSTVHAASVSGNMGSTVQSVIWLIPAGSTTSQGYQFDAAHASSMQSAVSTFNANSSHGAFGGATASYDADQGIVTFDLPNGTSYAIFESDLAAVAGGAPVSRFGLPAYYASVDPDAVSAASVHSTGYAATVPDSTSVAYGKAFAASTGITTPLSGMWGGLLDAVKSALQTKYLVAAFVSLLILLVLVAASLYALHKILALIGYDKASRLSRLNAKDSAMRVAHGLRMAAVNDAIAAAREADAALAADAFSKTAEGIFQADMEELEALREAEEAEQAESVDPFQEDVERQLAKKVHRERVNREVRRRFKMRDYEDKGMEVEF